jgi:hypothetical protein
MSVFNLIVLGLGLTVGCVAVEVAAALADLRNTTFPLLRARCRDVVVTHVSVVADVRTLIALPEWRSTQSVILAADVFIIFFRKIVDWDLLPVANILEL